MENDIGPDRIDEFFLTTTDGEVYERIIGYVDRIIIERALTDTSGNQISAAKFLGINRNTLHFKIRKLGIDIQRFKK